MFRVRPLPYIQFLSVSQYRQYTPIWQPAPPLDYIAQLRTEDETQTLWNVSNYNSSQLNNNNNNSQLNTLPLPMLSVNGAVEAWIRFGNDPVLHTSFPIIFAGRYHSKQEIKEKLLQEENKEYFPPSTSPFTYAEDYMGTNMIFGTPIHVKESAEVWNLYFEKRYLTRLRQSRRTVANHVGLINAPETFTDEADRPETKWSQDTFFRECAYMSEKILKEKVHNLQQFEQALKRATPEAYLAFYDLFQQQTQTYIPLPSPSVWHYEGDKRKQWAEKYIPFAQEVQLFFDDILANDIKKLNNSPEKLLQKVAAVFHEVGKVYIQRYQRFLKGRMWSDLTEEEKNIFCMKEIKRWQKQIEDGEFDPPEEIDESNNNNNSMSTEEWNSEHETIMKLMNSTIDELSFNALDFWKYTIRCEELETEHIHTEERIRNISAAARKLLYDTTSFETIIQGIIESISRGKLDLSAGVFRPYLNDIWCQLNYAKFGASTITQHTTTARRQLLFFHAGSLKEVAATANLYYSTKPLSNTLDYSSPYKFRRSLVYLCSNYGIEMSYATQRPLLIGAAHLARAEDLIYLIVKHVAHPFGEKRRAAIKNLHLNQKRLVEPIENIIVTVPNSELLESGADLFSENISNKQKEEKITMWPLGSKRVISYNWKISHFEKLKIAIEAAKAAGTAVTAERVKEIQDIKQRAFLEISLWRRLTSEELKQRKELKEKEENKVAEALRNVPSLTQVQKYANSLYKRIEETVPFIENSTNNNKEKDNDNSWEFAVMLDDRVTLNVDQSVELYLPYTDSNGVPLPQGEYRVRVRGFDLDLNDNFNSTLCSESFSDSFNVFDAIPQLMEQFFKDSEVLHIKSSDFIPFCTFLREAGLDIPVRCEFEAGQTLTNNGDIFMQHFLQLLRSNEFHRSCAEAGLTEIQLKIEPVIKAHWELYHPGANDLEWAEARRYILDKAMTQEREWWFPNEMLDVKDIITGSSNEVGFQMYPASVRYGNELCTVLTAEAVFNNNNSGLSAICSVDGTGAADSLTFTTNNNNNSNHMNISIDEALSVAKNAIRKAHDRHNTLSAFRLGPISKQNQMMIFCGINAMEFGGKYARTYAYAFDKAKRELAETALSGRMLAGINEEDISRISEKENVDRFASSTHPEQRKAQFVARVGPGGTPIEDPTADQKTEWGK